MRRLSFYLRLAGQNIRKNYRFYLPYILCCVGTAGMFYIMSFLTQDQMIEEMAGAVYVRTIMWLGVLVLAIFSVFILLYTNSFIMKRRRRELGLYNILGMEKRNIAVLMTFETLILAVCSIGGGLFFGILFSKLMILILARVLRFGVPMGFSVNSGAVQLTAAWFLGVFALTLIFNIIGVLRARPIELLHSENSGEKEPKTKWLLSLIGFLSLGGGYYIAATTENPITALSIFFVAVLLVMLGTYCLFTAGSIVLLKLLRKNKRFYYRTGPFTAVSGLLYRMKQNAVGLANICILSTMVLVTVSTTVCLYTGVGDIVNSQHPYEIEIDLKGNGSISAEEQAEADQIVDETLAQNGLTAGRESYFALQFGAAEMDGGYRLMSNSFGNSITVDLGFLTAEDYNALTGENITLQKDEVLCYATPAKTADTLTIGEMTFAIRENLDSYPATNWWVMNNVIEGVGLVVADQEVMEQLWQLQYDVYGEKYCSDLQYIIGLEFDGTADQKLGCYYGMLQALRSSGLTFNASSRQSSADDTYLLYGSFLFLGIFLGAVFLMAAVLIIYYKQVSEGYEDRERFVILQKVGMDAATVKKSIRSQVLLVFFLPLLTAGIHIAFAFRLITRMLQLFYLQNVGLFATCTIVTLLLFAAVYVLIYALTARTYYKIVAGSRG